MNLNENYFFNLALRNSESKLGYFFRCFFTSTLSLWGMVAAYVILFGLPNIADIRHYDNVMVELMVIVAFYPCIESLLLVYPTSVAKTAIQNDLIAAIVGASFIVALHAFSGVIKVLFVLPVFFVQAFAYIQLRKNQNSFWTAYAFVFALHALHNATTMALDRLDDL